MNPLNKSTTPIFSIITIILGGMMIVFGLLFGIANLIHPDVPDSYLDQNTRVCVMLIITSLVVIYAIFRPYSGGILLCICALAYFIIVNNPLVYPIILLGILSIIRGIRERRKGLDENTQTS
jgi:hypothetical protein